MPSEWLDRIEQAKKIQDKYKGVWTENVQLYNGLKKFRKQKKYETEVNLLYMSYKTDKANCIPHSMDFYAQIAGRTDPNTSALVSGLLNNQLATSENVMMTGKLHTQAVCKGVGIVQVDYEQAASKKRSVEYEGKSYKISEGMDKVRIKFFKTEDVLYDTEAQCFSEVKWIGGSYRITVEEFMADAKYGKKQLVLEANGIDRTKDQKNKSDFSNLKTNLTTLNLGSAEVGGGNDYKDPKFARIKIWEIWDCISRTKIHVEDESGEVVYEEEYPIKNANFYHPFEFLTFTEEDGESLPPVSEFDLVKEWNEILNGLVSAVLRDTKRGVRGHAVWKDAVDSTEMQKLLNGDKNFIISLDRSIINPQTGGDLRSYILPLAENPAPPDRLSAVNTVISMMQQTIGYGSMERGGMPQTSTATEANLVASYMAGRTRVKLVKVLDFWKRVAQKAMIVMAEKFDDEQVVMMSEYGTPPVWKKMQMDIIKDNQFTIDVFAGSKGIIDRQTKLQELLQTVRDLFPLAQQYGWDLSAVARKILTIADWKPLEIESLFSNRKDIAKQVAVAFTQAMEGGIDEQEAMMLWGMVSQLVQANLSPEDWAQIQGKFGATGGQAPSKQGASGPGSQRTSKPTEDMNRGFEGG